jgi:hypothetical protein
VTSKLSSWYAAGRAIGLLEIGKAADVDARDTPSATIDRVRNVADYMTDLPTVQADGSDLLPLIAGTEAVARAVKTGAVRVKRRDTERLISGATIEQARTIRALANNVGDDVARKLGDAINERATALVTWRWHVVKHLAAAIAKRRSMSGAEVAAFLKA